MAQKIPRTIPPNRFQSLVERVLASVKIDDLIGAEPIRVVTSDRVSTAPCPFHSPHGDLSLVIDSNNDKFHCTQCGFKGTTIGWLMYYSGIDVIEAVVDLANSAGISYEDVISDDALAVVKKRRNRLLQNVVDEYQLAARTSDEAMRYLHKKRGIDDEHIALFGIGWCARGRLPKSQRNRDLWRYGLLGRQVSGDYYSRFGGRIVFPIKDNDGHIVGFGGRLLNDGTNGPKYLNSATSRYFQKQNILYGLYESLIHSRSPERFIVVEGYMDVIALHQAGFRSTVATLGTAINCTHILQLFRFTDRISFCFDQDRAGSDATLKAICQALTVIGEGQEINVISLPQGTDPDSYLKENGVTQFIARADEACCVESWLRDRLISDAWAMRRTSRIDKPREELPPDTDLDVSTRARVAMAFDDLLRNINSEEVCSRLRRVAEATLGTQI